jgi:hypothetical protein
MAAFSIYPTNNAAYSKYHPSTGYGFFVVMERCSFTPLTIIQNKKTA